MRLKSWLMVALLLVVGVSWQQAPRAMACSCALGTTAEYVAAADLVAEGIVVGVDRPADAEPSMAEATYSVELSRVWKGPQDTPQVAIMTAVQGASCGWEGIDEGMVIALFANLDGDAWRSTLCSGTASMTPELDTELTAEAGEPAQVIPTSAQTPSPATDVSERTILVYISLGVAGVALVVLAVIAWARRRAEN